jgi:hypothetical protein
MDENSADYPLSDEGGLDIDSHAFVIRIWLEDIRPTAGAVLWRGHITHVPDHRRRYFQDLNYIASFIAPYLDRWGILRDLNS